MPLWIIPMVYTLGSVMMALVLPRLEQLYFPGYTHGMSVAVAIAFFSAVSSGMMALTGIVFAIAFVVVQFSAIAYSPRLVVTFGTNPTLYHTLGVFFATFAYSLAALVWTDPGGTGSVPLFSTLLVAVLLHHRGTEALSCAQAAAACYLSRHSRRYTSAAPCLCAFVVTLKYGRAAVPRVLASQPDAQALFIDGFQQSWAGMAVHLNCQSDDLLGQ